MNKLPVPPANPVKYDGPLPLVDHRAGEPKNSVNTTDQPGYEG